MREPVEWRRCGRHTIPILLGLQLCLAGAQQCSPTKFRVKCSPGQKKKRYDWHEMLAKWDDADMQSMVVIHSALELKLPQHLQL